MTVAIEESTVLALGARGTLAGRPFRLAGRTCVRSSTGGLWNEWLLTFDTGPSLVLGEARGLFTLYEERPLAPRFEDLRAGAPLDTGFASGLVVTERGEAERLGAWGEAPDSLPRYLYAELSSPSGEPVTFVFGDATTRIFAGRRVTLGELGLTARASRPRFLPAPDGPLPEGVELWLDVGDEGPLGGALFRVTAVLCRSARVGSGRASWEEYLLHAPDQGFRWLVVADGHWNLAREIEPGAIAWSGEEARYGGDTFRPLSSLEARLDWATGELPWQAAIGDVSELTELVCAPHILSREAMPEAVSWTRSTYLPPEELARGFGKRVLPKPRGRAPNQPQPPRSLP
jgi:hypothetical protein